MSQQIQKMQWTNQLEVNPACNPYQTGEKARELFVLIGWKRHTRAYWTEHLARVFWGQLQSCQSCRWIYCKLFNQTFLLPSFYPYLYLPFYRVVRRSYCLSVVLNKLYVWMSLNSFLSLLRKVCKRTFSDIHAVCCRFWVKTILMSQNSWTIWPCYVKTKENMTRYVELHPY